MYKLIGFDYGGVVYGESGGVFDTLISNTLSVDLESYRRAYFKHSKISDTDKRWRAILKELEKEDFLQEIKKVASVYSTRKQLNSEILSIVSDLKAAGYKVGLLSNNSKERAYLMREQELEKIFDVFCVSAEIGYRKPDRQSFEYLVSQAGCSLKDLLFIDDTKESVQGLVELGAGVIIYQSSRQLRSELNRRLILHTR